MQYVITKEQDGMTVRDFLRQYLKPSSKMLKYLKYRPDGITVDGAHCTVRYILREGNILSVALLDPAPSEKLRPVKLPIEILYEDEDLVVPSKPADMPTHPSHDHYDDTVANALAYRYREMGIPFVFRPINRLDRNTSGLLLVARNKLSAGRLTRALDRGEIRKRYLAVLDGEMTEQGGVIDACLHRTAKSIIIREVCSPNAPDADAARTEFSVLAVANGHTLVEASPITGRTHQLRVHFAHLGHPITGDDLYGTPSDAIPRHALHAYSLSFPHPATDQPMTLTAPIPADLSALLHSVFPDLDEIGHRKAANP
ncbi:MAG: RluA family pseudouridine synthase [Clostridia bacterium]|nr:RluA family pseudouridine synthase [Clostridia bacterium]